MEVGLSSACTLAKQVRQEKVEEGSNETSVILGTSLYARPFQELIEEGGEEAFLLK